LSTSRSGSSAGYRRKGTQSRYTIRRHASRRVAEDQAEKVLTFDEQLEKHERTIVDRKTEMAIIMDDTGKLVFKKTSRAVNYVKFTKDELDRMKGQVLTHNHGFS
jgi:hypothetical protein